MVVQEGASRESFLASLDEEFSRPRKKPGVQVRGLPREKFLEQLDQLFPGPEIETGVERAGRAALGSLYRGTAAVARVPQLVQTGLEDIGLLEPGTEALGAEFARKQEAEAEALLPQAKRTGSFLAETLPEAVGQLPTTIAAGAAGGPVGVGALGAAQGAVQGYYDILEATGGDKEKAWTGALGYGLLGSTEALGGAIVGRIPLLGRLVSKLDRRGLAKKRLLLAAIGSGGQEAGQESVQTGLQDAIREGLTGEDIDNWRNLAHGAGAGAVVGAVFQFFTGIPLDVAAKNIPRGTSALPAEAPGIAQEPVSERPIEPTPEEEIEAQKIGEVTRRDIERRIGERRAEFEGKERRSRALEALIEGEDVPIEEVRPGMVEEAVAAEKEAREKPIGLTEEEFAELEEEGEARRQAAIAKAGPERMAELERRAPLPDVDETVEEELERAKPQLLHAGIPITGEDIKADVASLVAKREAAKTPPDILGNRKTLAYVRAAVDYLEPHRRAKQARLGKGKDTVADYVAAEELRRSRTKGRTEKELRDYAKGLSRLMRAGGVSLGGSGKAGDPGLDRYVLARHAEEANRLVAERQPEVVEARKDLEAGKISQGAYDAILGRFASGEEIGIGMSTDQARLILEDVERGPKAKAYAELGKRFDRLNQRTRDLWREYGLAEEEAIAAMEEAYEHYAPARSDIEPGEALPVGRGATVRGRETRMRTGRTTAPDSPVAFAVAQMRQAIARGEANRVVEAWAGDIESNPSFWSGVAKITEGRKLKAVVEGVVREVPDLGYPADPNVIPLKRKGKQFYVEVDPKYAELARSLNKADANTLHPVWRLIRSVGSLTRTFAKLRTVYTPEFWATNLSADVAQGLFSSSEQGARFTRKWGKGILSSIGTLTAWKVKGSYPGGKDGDLLRRYVESGAPVTFLDFKTVEDIANDIERELKKTEPSAVRKITESYRGLLGILEGGAEVVENASRFAAFKAAIAEGKSDTEAALIAKNLTVNFERKGELGSAMNALYAFSTAGIGGIARTKRLLQNRNARRLVITAAGGMMLWDQIARALMGKDEDGEDCWDKVKGKEKYLHVPKYWTDDPTDTLRIRMPFQLAPIFFGAGEISASLSGNRDPAEAALNTAAAALHSMNPLGSGQEEGVHLVGKTVAPTVADPLVDLLANKDFAGRPIAPEGGQVDAYRNWPDVSPTAKRVARWLGEATGGDEWKPGKIDVSPETIELWTDQIFGGLGQFVRKSYLTAEALASGEPVDERQIPILSRFEGRVSPWASDRPFKQEMEEIRDEARRRGKGNFPAGEKRLSPRDKEILERGREYEKRLKEMKKRLDTLVEADKKEDAKKLEEKMDSLRQRFLSRYKRAQ